MKTLTISMPPRFHFELYSVWQKMSTKRQANYGLVIETASFEVALHYYREAKRRNPSLPLRISRKLYKANTYTLVETEMLEETRIPKQSNLPFGDTSA